MCRARCRSLWPLRAKLFRMRASRQTIFLGRAPADRCAARYRRRRLALRRRPLRHLVQRPLACQSQRLHHSGCDSRDLVERTFDGFWLARPVACDFDWMYKFDGRDRLRGATHRARPSGIDARRRCGRAFGAGHSRRIQSADGVDDCNGTTIRSTPRARSRAIDPEWC